MKLQDLRIQILVFFASFASIVWGTGAEVWNTVYSFSDGKIYIQLKNNDLVGLNFSVTGFGNVEQSGYSETELNLEDGQTVSQMSSPPANTTIFLIKDKLYGFNAGGDGGDAKDVCGDGMLQLVKYDTKADSWDSVDGLIFDGVDDGSFYQHATYMTLPGQDTVYVYGGVCEKTNEVSNRLLSFDSSKLQVSNLTTSTKPQPFYGATNLMAPDSQTQLVLGGQSNNGWLNMYQLATWDFDSGWSFRKVTDSSEDAEKINSRKFSSALPIFEPLANNSASTFSDYYRIKEILMIGGELLETDSTPLFAKLTTSSNEWSWTPASADLQYDEILGAATIFNTLVVVNSTTTTKRDSSSKYSVNLYDVNSFESIKSIKDNTKQSSHKSNDDTNVKKKAILGTVLPICAIAMAITAGLFIKKRRNQNSIDNANDMDYQFGNYYDQESVLSHKAKKRSNQLYNDTSSTLDNASIDSWVRKRQEFDTTRAKPLRDSYLASNETLSSNSSSLTKSEKPEPPVETGDLAMDKPLPTPLQTNLVNRSVSRLKKSLSFTNSPGSPIPGHELGSIKRKKSSNTLLGKPTGARILSEGPPVYDSMDITDLVQTHDDTDDSDSDASIDDKLDVQVLVSSKRRSVLRVVNPDLQTINDENEDNEDIKYETDDNTQKIAEIRQRIPSGEKSSDD